MLYIYLGDMMLYLNDIMTYVGDMMMYDIMTYIGYMVAHPNDLTYVGDTMSILMT